MEYIVAYTPEYCEKVGLAHGDDHAADAERPGDTLGQWAYGHVYCASIAKRHSCGEFHEHDFMDSCGGYIGENFSKSGVDEFTREMFASYDTAPAREATQ